MELIRYPHVHFLQSGTTFWLHFTCEGWHISRIFFFLTLTQGGVETQNGKSTGNLDAAFFFGLMCSKHSAASTSSSSIITRKWTCANACGTQVTGYYSPRMSQLHTLADSQ